jgi:pyridoxal phosphate enzyme (YggS family)
MIDPDRLRDVLAETRARLDEAAATSGRPPGSVEIVFAGKYVPAEEAPSLVRAGVTVVGENRLQDLEAKRALVGDALAFDFIGHVQRRKVKAILPLVRLIHSLDSVQLAEEISRRAEGPVRVLVEVNVGEEKTKSGIVPTQLRAFVQEVSCFPNLVLGGLMGMPPPQRDPEMSRPHFAALRSLLEDLSTEWHGRHEFRDLSMGTSQDFLVAAEEGATMVRVGRGLIDRATGVA